MVLVLVQKSRTLYLNWMSYLEHGLFLLVWIPWCHVTYRRPTLELPLIASLSLTKLCYTNTGRSGRWLCPVICMLPVNSLHYAKHCKNVFLVTVSMAAWQQCMSRPLNTRACDNPVTPPGFPPHTHTHVLWVPFALLNAILLLLCFVALAPKTTTTPWNALLVRAEQNTVVSLNWAPSECNSWVPVWCFTSPHTEVYSLQWPFGKITIC